MVGDRGRLLPGRPGEGAQAERRPRRRRQPGGLGGRRPERVRAGPRGLRARAHRLPPGDRGAARPGAGRRRGGALLVIGHDLTNLTEGVGGPQSPDVLYTPEVITAELPGLRIVRADRVHRTVERDGGTATAIDTLVRAERPAR